MAGSYAHITTKSGKLRSPESMEGMIENLGDAYEALEECYEMIKHLTNGDKSKIEEAVFAAQRSILRKR